MTISLDIQIATAFLPLPDEDQFGEWVSLVLGEQDESELTLRLVDEDESRELNTRFRGKPRPTNVLSFPAELPSGIELPLLGDVVICAPLVAEEAEAQNKPVLFHWAHLVIHGVLHLLGHDHQAEDEAEEMESLEAELLACIGIPNPYL
jgi:probable rRNA maturation factor